MMTNQLYKGFFGNIQLRKGMTGALLLSLLVSSWSGGAVQGQSSGTWKLKEIRVFNNMSGQVATITREQYDENGGSVDIQMSGAILDFCPGGFEKIRFT